MSKINIKSYSIGTIVPCKVGRTKTDAGQFVDFNKSCTEQKGIFLPKLGLNIEDRQCPACKLLFTSAFDDWSREDFQTHIYNHEYVNVDPGLPAGRAYLLCRNNAKFFPEQWKDKGVGLRRWQWPFCVAAHSRRIGRNQ